ncbi:Uncharacterized membrane protein YadS [Micrococcales bacterium KH10]|nr:Uncharacterized membrane protein YadS [Micrococcales bacterium KH10]
MTPAPTSPPQHDEAPPTPTTVNLARPNHMIDPRTTSIVTLSLTIIGLACVWLNRQLPVLSAMLLGLIVGIIVASTVRAPKSHTAHRIESYLSAASPIGGHLLRLGVALLGLKLSLADIAGLGIFGVLVAVVTLVVTFAVTVLLARQSGAHSQGALVLGAGFSVCGAAAASTMAAALRGSDRDEHDRRDSAQKRAGITLRRLVDEYAVATIGLVSVLGLVMVPLLLWAAHWLGLSQADTGLWIGASLPEVAHVVMAGDMVSPEALNTATIAKLTRVVLLAPLVMVTTAGLARRAARHHGSFSSCVPVKNPAKPRRALPIPPFIVAFLGCVLLRSLDVIPAAVLTGAEVISSAFFAAAMVTVGASISWQTLVGRWRSIGLVAILASLTALVVPAIPLAIWR